MKKCSRCKLEKDLSCFSKCKSKPDGLWVRCKECDSRYMKERYKKCPEEYREKNKQYYRKNRDSRLMHLKEKASERAEFINSVKESRGCKKCGITDYRVLHFHHRDPSQKSFNIGSGATRSLSNIKKEIEKCYILCANCHAILHHEEEQNGVIVKRGRPRTF